MNKFPYLDEPLKKGIILCHRHADVDAYCSAYSVAALLRHLHPRSTIETASPQGFGMLARKVQESYPMKVVEDPVLGKADLIVVVDTGHALLLDDWAQRVQVSSAVKVFVDHHSSSRSIEHLADHKILNCKASSTCEIVYRIFEAKAAKITRRTAQVLVIGIVCDSQHLGIAGCRTLDVVNRLCSLGASLHKARKILSLKRDTSEVIARFKAAQRSEIYQAGRWIIATTRVGSFQSSAARALIDLGAHVSFALGESDEGVKGSSRATQEFCSDSGVHLGRDITKKAAEASGGVGGGHPGAASFTGKSSLKEAHRKVLTLLSEKLQLELRKVG